VLAGAGAGGFASWIRERARQGRHAAHPAIHHLEGTAKVNGRDAKVGHAGRARRPQSRPEIAQPGGARARGRRLPPALGHVARGEGQGRRAFRAVGRRGKVLSVFAKKPTTIKAATASIGIRGRPAISKWTLPPCISAFATAKRMSPRRACRR
jgi:hypothetical protein